MWHKISDGHPERGGVFVVRRDSIIFTATVCYGMHAPWWVPRVPSEGLAKVHETEPINMEPNDLWTTLHELNPMAAQREIGRHFGMQDFADEHSPAELAAEIERRHRESAAALNAETREANVRQARLLGMATRFQLETTKCKRLEHATVTIELRSVIGEPRWAVCCEGGVLNTHNEWEYEPNPSSRSDAFKKRTRFDTIEEAEAAFRRFEERCQPEE